MPLGAAHTASVEDSVRSECNKGSGRNFYSTGFSAPASCRPQQSVGGRFLFGCSNRLEPHALSIALAHTHRLALAFVALEELGIVIGFAVHALPGEQRVVAGRQAANAKASTLIGQRFAITLRTVAEARFGHGDDDRDQS